MGGLKEAELAAACKTTRPARLRDGSAVAEWERAASAGGVKDAVGACAVVADAVVAVMHVVSLRGLIE